MELLPNLFNRPPSTIVPVEVKGALQYFDNNPQPNYLSALSAGQVHPRTETVLVRMSTFVPHFLALLLLAECQSPKAMLYLAVPSLVQQHLLLNLIQSCQ